MNLFETLTQIAEHFGLKADDLISYANEDTVGGFNADATKSTWPIGSLWEVEGKTLYALVRALKPRRLLEFGTMHGCSAVHMAKALEKNDNGGTLVCVDFNMDLAAHLLTNFPDTISLVQMPFEEFVAEPTVAQFDFVYEDSIHSTEQVAMLWRYAVDHMLNGLILSHDAMHYIVGDDVRRGIQAVVGDKARYYLTAPSDCGLGIYRKVTEIPLQVEDEEEIAPPAWPDEIDIEELPEFSEPAPRRKRTRKAKA